MFNKIFKSKFYLAIISIVAIFIVVVGLVISVIKIGEPRYTPLDKDILLQSTSTDDGQDSSGPRLRYINGSGQTGTAEIVPVLSSSSSTGSIPQRGSESVGTSSTSTSQGI